MLILDMSKYDFEYVCQKKNSLSTYPNVNLSTYVKGKVDVRPVQI
jgi:hypothetical protein